MRPDRLTIESARNIGGLLYAATCKIGANNAKPANDEKQHTSDPNSPTGHLPAERPFQRISVDLVEYKWVSTSAVGTEYKLFSIKTRTLHHAQHAGQARSTIAVALFR